MGENYNLARMMHCLTGKGMTEGADLEKRFSDIRDPRLARYWAGFGLDYTVYETGGAPWLSFVPKSAVESGERLPAVLVFRPACVFAQSFYYYLNLIAAQGETILLYFSTESVDGNELFLKILEEAEALYPIDAGRVYTAGHSHYGEFACEFAARHPHHLRVYAHAQLVFPQTLSARRRHRRFGGTVRLKYDPHESPSCFSSHASGCRK